jgi:hypothetical protein
MSDKLSFACPSCRARLRARVRLVGQARRCPGCGDTVVVRPCAPEESEPMLVTDEDAYCNSRTRPTRS